MKFCRQCGAALAATTPGSPAMGAPMMGPPGGAPMMPPPGPLAMPPGGMPMTVPAMPMPGPSPMPMPGPGAMPMPMPMANPALAPTPLPPPPRGPDASPPRVAPQGSTITCPRCGTSTPLGFAYCQQCGLHMQGVVPTDPSQQRARQPSRPPPVIVNAAALGVDPMAGTLAQPEAARAAVVGAPVPSSAPAIRPSAGPALVPRPATGAQWGSAVLVNRDGSDGQRFALTSEDTVIGRAGADIAFDDDRFLARQHARIARAADGTVTIHPIDTVNGVFRKAAEPTELADGAIILLGREVLRFERVAQEERAAAPLVRHGVALFGSPPREPWGRLLQLLPSAGHRDVRHLAGEEVVLGREEGDIVFRDDAFMSRRHAALTWDGKRAMLTDLGSSNGTFVRLTAPTVLKHGDHVRLGDQLLRIEK